MPTERQIKAAIKVAREQCPGARIKEVGPKGVVFEYPEQGTPTTEWEGKPFTGDAT
jgi:hypothetical protein